MTDTNILFWKCSTLILPVSLDWTTRRFYICIVSFKILSWCAMYFCFSTWTPFVSFVLLMACWFKLWFSQIHDGCTRWHWVFCPVTCQSVSLWCTGIWWQMILLETFPWNVRPKSSRYPWNLFKMLVDQFIHGNWFWCLWIFVGMVAMRLSFISCS